MLKLNDVTKIYQTASKEKVTALSNVSLSLDKNGLVFIVGQSGSGKTTLLNLIGGLDMPEQGELIHFLNLVIFFVYYSASSIAVPKHNARQDLYSQY